jgi:CO/xanthine dehydrogenase FAD-binding subunit
MKPVPFEYRAPSAIEDAVTLLAERGADAKVLAGGQSLVPLLNVRFARPALLVDINGISELAYLRHSTGRLRIGALTRQSTLERSKLVAARWPLITDAVRLLAHPEIRNRGTVGGSVAHADAAAELPVAFSALDATFHTCSVRGTRAIPAREFFRAHLTTALEPDELLLEIDVGPLPPRTGQAFTEFARRHGGFALGGAAVLVTLGDDGTCERAAIALLGAGPVPVRAADAERVLEDGGVDEPRITSAASAAVADIHPIGDTHGSSAYRRELIEALVARGIRLATARAMKERHAEAAG